MAPPAGYSGTPLVRKLGIGEGDTVALIDEPDGFRPLLDPLPDAVTFRTDLRGRNEVVVAFFDRRSRFAARLGPLGRTVFAAGSLWIAWPKKAAKVPTDMSEDVVREVALPTGLVDVKVCAIDDTWSGLKLVWRKELR